MKNNYTASSNKKNNKLATEKTAFKNCQDTPAVAECGAADQMQDENRRNYDELGTN